MVRLKIILLIAFLSSVAESRYGFRRLPMKVIEQELFTFSNTTHKSRFTVFVLGTKYAAGSYPEALSYCTRKHRALPNATTTWNSVEFQKAADNKGIIGYAIACPKSGNTYCTTKKGHFSASSITRHQIVCMAIEKVTCNDNPCSPGDRCVDQPNAFQAYTCPKVTCTDNPCPQQLRCIDQPQRTPGFNCYGAASGARIDKSKMPTILSVADKYFSSPWKQLLFPSLIYKKIYTTNGVFRTEKVLYEPRVWPLKEQDIFIGVSRNPDFRSIESSSPQQYCNVGSRFWGAPKSFFDDYGNFYRSFLSSGARGHKFFTSNYKKVSKDLTFNYWDGTQFASGQYKWAKKAGWSANDVIPRDTGYLCVAVTYKNEEKECGGKSYLTQRWSVSGGHFQPALDLCRLVMGFDFPTPNALASLMLYDNQCKILGRDFQNAWVQSDARHPVGVKRFICMGCHVHFMNADGMKHVDSNGKVTCKSGYILITKKNATRPTCLKDQVTGVWYWDNDTIGRCKLVVVTQNNMIYYHPTYERDLLGFQSLTCPNGHTKVEIAKTSIKNHPILPLLKRIIASWGSGMSAIYMDPQDTYAYNSTAQKFFTYSENKVTNIGHVCKTECTVNPTNGMKTVDRTDGLVTCHPGYLWSCPSPPCPREGQPRPLPICNGTNNGWRNIATCIPIVHTMLIQLLGVSQDLVIEHSTATVSCKGDTYETCVGKTKPCAGGPTNIAITNNGTHFTNLPSCSRFRIATGQLAHYKRSAGTETLDMAKWACNQIGAYLMTEIHYSLVKDENFFSNFNIQTLWMANSKGQVYQFYHNPGAYALHDFFKSDVVCVTYRADIQDHTGTSINFSEQPETCKDGKMPTARNGLEQCG